MPSVDELWAWLWTPLQELAARRADNREEPWDDLRAFFLERAGVRDAGDHPLIGNLLTRLDEMSADERDAILDDSGRLESLGYELTTQAADAPDEQSYDEAAWQQFLAENGPRWSGDDESWTPFTDWLLYYADAQGLTTPATELVRQLDAQSAPDRIETLARYGVRISPPEVETQPDELTEQDIQSVLDETTGFDDIPEERRRELIQQLVSGQ